MDILCSKPPTRRFPLLNFTHSPTLPHHSYPKYLSQGCSPHKLEALLILRIGHCHLQASNSTKSPVPTTCPNAGHQLWPFHTDVLQRVPSCLPFNCRPSPVLQTGSGAGKLANFSAFRRFSYTFSNEVWSPGLGSDPHSKFVLLWECFLNPGYHMKLYRILYRRQGSRPFP